MIFPDSELAHRYLDGLDGIEIGGSAHNPFNIVGEYRNVDTTDDMTTVFKQEEIRMCGRALPVDIVADGASLPLEDKSVGYVLSSHVIEHLHDPIAALLEWSRVAREYVFVIIPQRDALASDRTLPITSTSELRRRYVLRQTCACPSGQHCTRWTVDSFGKMLRMPEMRGSTRALRVVDIQEPDDKVGNGFTYVLTPLHSEFA